MRDTTIGVRVTESERGLLERAAASEGMAVATLLRREGLRGARRALRDHEHRDTPDPGLAPVQG